MKTYYERAKELKAQGNVKLIFDNVDYDFVSKHESEYDIFSQMIMEIVAKFSAGFVVDICEKALKKNIRLSEKQRWCIAYAFAKITDEQIDEYEAEDRLLYADDEENESEAAAEQSTESTESNENDDESDESDESGKKYVVRNQSAVNGHCLLSKNHWLEKEFITKSFGDAKKAFDEEVKALHEEYVTMEELGYCPSDAEDNHAVYCTLCSIDDDGEIDFLEDSEKFYSHDMILEK